MLTVVLDVVGFVALAAGLGLASVGVYGMLSKDELLHQVHAAGLITGPSVFAIMIASVATGNLAVITSAALVFIFVAVTAPLAGHAIAQAAADADAPDQGRADAPAGRDRDQPRRTSESPR